MDYIFQLTNRVEKAYKGKGIFKFTSKDNTITYLLSLLLWVIGSVKGCTKSGCDRGHVRKCDSKGNYISRQVYIVPLCTKHNRSRTDEVLEVKEGTNFIAINN